MVFLNQGSRIAGEVLEINAESVRLLTTLFGELTLPRADVQGIAFDPELDRLVGASVDHDRVRLRSGEILDGDLLRLDGGRVQTENKDNLPVDEVAGVLFSRPRMPTPESISTRAST